MDGKKTASSSPNELTAPQAEILHAFFARERGFFLTGGAALVGFYLHHRRTDDLDLFTVDGSAFERGPHVVADIAHRLGARLDVRQDAPGFRRYAISREDDAVVIDLVLDRAPQIVADKNEVSGIIVDPLREILANKLGALVGRAEERDLVDVLFLERAGNRPELALADALAKDGGCTPATLAWVLAEWEIPDSANLPAGIAPVELRAFASDLVRRFRRAAAP